MGARTAGEGTTAMGAYCEGPAREAGEAPSSPRPCRLSTGWRPAIAYPIGDAAARARTTRCCYGGRRHGGTGAVRRCTVMRQTCDTSCIHDDAARICPMIDRVSRATYATAAMAERRRKGAVKAGAEARICDAVRTAILERRLAPGTKLQEIPLGAFFGVSRTIVRQALRNRRVAVVARPSAAEVAQVFAARRAIEAAVVDQVCARITRVEIAALRQLVRDEEGAYRRGD